MRTPRGVAVLAFGLTVGLAVGLAFGPAVAAVAAARPADDRPAGNAEAAQVARLIKQLGSDSFEERELATKELEKLGTAALEALREAAKDGELEVQMRAQALLRKAEEKEQAAKRQAEAARVLAPRKVRLAYKEMPLAEAVADLARQSGYALQLHDPEGKLAAKKLTLETGEVSFWEALDRFCAAAGLVEAGARDLFSRPGGRGALEGPAVPGVPRRARPELPVDLVPLRFPRPQEAPGARGGAVAPGVVAVAATREETRATVPTAQALAAAGQAAQVPPVQPEAPERPQPVPPRRAFGVARPPVGVVSQPGVIVLAEGTPAPVPTSYSGAARVRALSPRDRSLPPAGEGVVLIPLEVRLEPRLQVQGVTGVRVSKAEDDQGQKLDQLADQGAEAAVGVAGGAGVVEVIQIQGGAVLAGPNAGSVVLPVRLKKGTRDAKTLKVLAGTMTVQVVLPPEPVITVDKVLKAQGETFKGKDGGFIKVTELTRTDDGLTVKLEMEPPPGVQAKAFGGGLLRGPGFRMRPIRPVPLPAPAPNNFRNKGPGGAFQVQIQPLPAQVLPAQAQVQIQIVGNGNAIFGTAGAQGELTLEDDKGLKIAPNRTQSQMRLINGQASYEQVLGFPLQKGQEPARLIYSGSRVIEVEVPFTLKDVPLS